jgi:hypothetical protein
MGTNRGPVASGSAAHIRCSAQIASKLALSEASKRDGFAKLAFGVLHVFVKGCLRLDLPLRFRKYVAPDGDRGDLK